MSTKLQEAEILIPITAKNFDSDVVEVKNLFMLHEKKQQLLTLCSSANIIPVDNSADSLKFKRTNLRAVAAIMQQLGLKPIITAEAEVSSVRQVSSAFNVEGTYSGVVQLSLNTTDGEVSLNTSIEVKDLDDADAAKLIRAVRSAANMFNKPMNVNLLSPESDQNTNLVPYVEPQQVEELRSHLQASMENLGHFTEYFITMDNLPTPKGLETKKTYATTIKIAFPDGKVSKVELEGSSPTVFASGDTLIGPHPKLLPLQAGVVKYTIVEASPDTVSFFVTHKGTRLNAAAFKLTRDQFEDLATLYHAKKQSTTAFNVIKKEAFKDERQQKLYETLRDKPSKTPDETKMLKDLEKESGVKNGVTAPPQGSPPNLIKPISPISPIKPVASTEPTTKIFQALGLW